MVECAKYKNMLDKDNLKIYIHHGEMFDKFYGFWIPERANGNVMLNWNDWLKDNTFESKRNIREKRELAQFIKLFPRLQYVTNSLNEFHCQKKKT